MRRGLVILTDIKNSELHINSQNLSQEILTTFSEIENFYVEWFNFWKHNPCRTPFNSPWWLIPWIKYFGSEKIFFIVFRKSGAVVGCIPLYIFTSLEKRRYLKIIGTGNSDYLDLLVNPVFSKEIFDCVFHFIVEIKDQHDVFEIKGQRHSSLFLKYIQRTPGLKDKILDDDVAPVLKLSSDFENYIKTLSLQFRKNTQRADRKLLSWNYKFIKADPEEIQEVFNNLVGLHNAEWSLRNSKGVLNDNTVLKFLKDVVEIGTENKTAALYALRSNSEYAAINLIFNAADTFYYYIGAYNPTLQKYSPGSVILFKIIQECINNGITYFDFLRGAEPYKYKWNAKDQKIYRVQINP